MPGPCGGPGDGTNEGTKDGKCTNEGKRHGKGEHSDKWCCTGNKCREALGIIESAAAKKAAKQAAAPDEEREKAAAAAKKQGGKQAAVGASPATAAAGAAVATVLCRNSAVPEVHVRRWRKTMLGPRGTRIQAVLLERLSDAEKAEFAEISEDLTHMDWVRRVPLELNCPVWLSVLAIEALTPATLPTRAAVLPLHRRLHRGNRE